MTTSTSTTAAAAKPIRIYTSPHPPVTNIPRQSLFTFLFPNNDPHPSSSPAFIDTQSGDVLTRGQLAHRARVLAYNLRLRLAPLYGALNVSRHATILFFSGNSIHVPLGILGALAGGIKISMASSALTPPELAYQIKDSTPSHLFVAPELVATAVAALKSLDITNEDIRRRLLLLAPRKDVEAKLDKQFAKMELLNLDDLLRDDRELFPENFDGDQSEETAMLFYSSGTTGV